MNKPEQAPNYYLGPNGIQCWDVIDALFSPDYYLASAFAYLWRCGQKPGASTVDDVRKATNHLLRYLELAQEQTAPVPDEIEPPDEASLSEPEPEPEPEPSHEMSLMDRLRASIALAKGNRQGDEK